MKLIILFLVAMVSIMTKKIKQADSKNTTSSKDTTAKVQNTPVQKTVVLVNENNNQSELIQKEKKVVQQTKYDYPKDNLHYDPNQVYQGQSFHHPTAIKTPAHQAVKPQVYDPSKVYTGLNYHYPYHHAFRFSQRLFQSPPAAPSNPAEKPVAEAKQKQVYPKHNQHYDPSKTYQGQNFHYPAPSNPTKPHVYEHRNSAYDPSKEYKPINYNYPYHHSFRFAQQKLKKAKKDQIQMVDAEIKSLIDSYEQLKSDFRK